ncbi:MAG: YfhO family protein [Patescibacteria group bacterium]
MKNFIKDHWLAILVFSLANVAMFWPMYFKGLIPFPGDLLVSFFFPWNIGGFPDFNPWTTHKEYLAADAIRQIFVWKSLGFNLWNPYNFAGSFLFANLQSSFLFPGNLIGWVPSVVLIMSLFGFFTYLFLRSLNLSKTAAIFGGLAAANISYLTGWQEILVNCQSALFLPLILLLINKNKTLLASIFLAFSIFGGHVQTTLYVYMIAGLYAIYKKSLKLFVVSCLLSVGLAAVQLVPTIEAYLLSARETPTNVDLLMRTTLPWQGLITYFVSDFFGNTASFNFRLFNYADARAYIGLVPAVMSLFSVFLIKDKNVRFFLFLAVFGLLLATWPGGLMFIFLKIPILSSVIPARIVMVFLFAAAILSAYGLEYFLRNKLKIIPLIFVFSVFVSLWIGVFIIKTPDAFISRNNLIIPTVVFITLILALLLIKKFPKLIVIIFLLAILEPAYYFVKHQPFAPSKFVFPPHSLFQFLQEKAGINRFYGSGQAYIDNNFATYYHIYSPEGYDPLYIKRYGELIFSSFDGQLHKEKIPRSDAKFVEQDNPYRTRLFDLLGIKYILDRENQPKDSLAWLERKSALPRVFLADNYVIESDPQKILGKIYDPNFNLRKILILEEPISSFWPRPESTTSAEIVSYEPSRVVVQTQSSSQKILFISDNYYPGWKAFVGGHQTKIYRANYSFRAVSLPAGDHQVVFQYDPWSFKIGVIISVVSLSILLVCLKRFSRT